MAHKTGGYKPLTYQLRLLDGVDIPAALAGDLVLTRKSGNIQILDPGAGNRNVDLPVEAESNGLAFLVRHSGAANDLVVRNPAAGTVATVTIGLAALVVCDGSAWAVAMGPI